MKTQALVLLLTIISLIYSSDTNNTNNTNETTIDKINKINLTETFDGEQEYKIPEDEMDKILFCSVIWQTKTEDEKENINNLIKELNNTDEDLIYNKISVGLMKSCLDTVKIEEVRKYFNNLTYFNGVTEDNIYFKNAKIDFEGYKKNATFNLSIDEEILLFKYEKTMKLYEEKKREDFMKDADNRDDTEKVKIGKLDINNIPKTINFILFLVVFGSLFGGTLYFIKSINKKKEKKKKKNKQK